MLGYPFSMGERITKAMPPPVMGKDVPLAKHLRPQARALLRGRGVPRAVRDRRGGQAGRRDRARAGGAQAAMGRARLRGDHVEPAARRHHPDHEAGAGRRDHHAVRLPDLRVARPAEDGLPRACATSPSSTTRWPTSRRNRGETVVMEDLEFDDPATYALLGRGDTLGVFQLDGGPMRSLLRALRPDVVRRHHRRPRVVPPGPMGANAHNDYADRKNGRKPVAADPPGARRAAARDPRRDLRPGRLPGAGHGDRPQGRRLLAGQARTCCAGRWARRRRRSWRSSTRTSPPAWPSVASRPRRSRRCGTRCCRSATTASTRATRAGYGWSPTGRHTSRRTTRPSTWPRCSPPCATTRTSPRCTWPSAAGWASRCCRRA